jgi:hypothetical protein
MGGLCDGCVFAFFVLVLVLVLEFCPVAAIP